jgi:hypothetical protein
LQSTTVTQANGVSPPTDFIGLGDVLAEIVVPDYARHDHGVAVDHQRVLDATLIAFADSILREAECLAQPIDGSLRSR